MAQGTMDKAVAFTAGLLKKNPEATMAELKAAGKKKGINVYPLVIGYAKRQLGLGKAKRRSTAKAARGRPRKTTARRPGRPRKTTARRPGRPRKAGRPAPRAAGRRGPGRPRKPADPTVALSHLASYMKELEREVKDLRGAIQKITDISKGV